MMRSNARSDCHVWQFIRRDRGFVSLGELGKAIKVLHGAVPTGRSTRMLHRHIRTLNHRLGTGLGIIPKEARRTLHLSQGRRWWPTWRGVVDAEKPALTRR